MLSSIQQRIFQLLPRGSFSRNVAVLASGTAFAQLITILASPILTRLYTPEDLGNLSVYISLFSLVVVIASFRYEMAIPLPEEDETAANILILCIALVISTTFLCTVLLVLFGDALIEWLNAPLLLPYLWILPVSLFGVGIYQVLNYWAIRKAAFSRIAQTKLTQSMGQVITQVGLGLLQVGLFGLLIGDAVGRISGISTLATLTWKTNKKIFRSASWQKILGAATRYRRFPLISTGATLLNSFNLFSPPLLTTAMYGTQVTGWLALSHTVLGIPSFLLATSVAQVYMSEAAKITSKDPNGQLTLFWKTILRLTVIGLPILASIAFISPFVFQIVFGESWDTSARYLQILTPMYFLQFLGSPISGALDVMERQDLQVIREVARSILLLGAVFVSQAAHFEAETWIVVYSIVTSLAYFLYILISWHAIRSALDRQDFRN